MDLLVANWLNGGQEMPCLALPFVYPASFPRMCGLQLCIAFILDRQLKQSDSSGGILQALISFFTVWSNVFLGRHGGLVPGTSMYNASWIQPVSRSTWPYQRRQLQLRTLVIDGICNCSSNDSELLLSHFTLQIQRIIAAVQEKDHWCRSSARFW